MRQVDKTEINFETGKSEATLDTRLSCIKSKQRVLKNPYTGNKRKLIPHIFKFLDDNDIVYDRFFDLFNGSAVVGMAAKYLGCEVYANDLMKFAHVNAVSLIKGTGEPIPREDIVSAPVSDGLTQSYYSDRFTDEEARTLDWYRSNISKKYGDDLGDHQTALAITQVLHCVMDHCFLGGRLNHGQVLADLEHRLKHARNEGRSIDWAKIPRYDFTSLYRDMKLVERNHQCFNQDAIDLISDSDCPDADLCYIDPPYGGNQSDYSKMYQYFEDYVAGEPSETDGSDKFVNKKSYSQHFESLLSSAEKFPSLLLSYNDSSWGGIDEITDILKRFRERVVVREVEYDYQYRSRSSSAKEYLILGE